MTIQGFPGEVRLFAVISADRSEVRLRKGNWKRVIPATRFDTFVTLYQTLHDRQPSGAKVVKGPGPWAQFYAADLAVLRGVQRRLREV